MDTMNAEALRKNQLNKIVKIARQDAELIVPKIIFAPEVRRRCCFEISNQ
jgi:hypothetical protein